MAYRIFSSLCKIKSKINEYLLISIKTNLFISRAEDKFLKSEPVDVSLVFFEIFKYLGKMFKI